ncbi:hypothetical protein FOA52_001829 [Chlamydomonas sp. UWO 241]|nr:hypothetical protein FOA52_001829 [Chlamydomonas sp. UWO 241]
MGNTPAKCGANCHNCHGSCCVTDGICPSSSCVANDLGSDNRNYKADGKGALARTTLSSSSAEYVAQRGPPPLRSSDDTSKPKDTADDKSTKSAKSDTKSEKSDTKSEKSDTMNEKLDTKSEKSDTKSEKSDTKSEKSDTNSEKSDAKSTSSTTSDASDETRAPPSPPPPRPTCDIVLEFCVMDAMGVDNHWVPYSPTSETCADLKAYAESLGNLVFSCLLVSATPEMICVRATGAGSVETTNAACAAAGTDDFYHMYAEIG